MFEHFTFGAQAQTSYPQPEEGFPSPTDCSFRIKTPPPTSSDSGYDDGLKGGINDIVNAFSSQSLTPDENEEPQRSIWSTSLPSPDFDTEMPEFTPEELSYISTGRGKVSLPEHNQSLPNLSSISNPRNGTVACRRLQRQLNVQLQTCNHHIRDITSLVEDMISTSSQCRLYTPASPFVTEPLELDPDEEQLPESIIPEDEGFAEMEDDEMTLRRASTPSGIRKWNVRFRANGESYVGVGMGGVESGRRKVRCVPRMRRRKPKTVPEGEQV